jgi:protein-S-isoprenylcysteine O-methyltransferase Ste14
MPYPTLIVYVAIVLAGRMLSQSQRRTPRPSAARWQSIARDPTAIASGLAVLVAVGTSLIDAAQREFTSPVACAVAGGIFLAVGWGIAYAANREIAGHWSPSIEKTDRQQLVSSGIYGVVRHPLYLSGVLFMAGTNIYFRCGWGWLGTLLALIIILLRIPLEERKLEARFGEQYRAYRQKTRAIFPWVF